MGNQRIIPCAIDGVSTPVARTTNASAFYFESFLVAGLLTAIQNISVSFTYAGMNFSESDGNEDLSFLR